MVVGAVPKRPERSAQRAVITGEVVKSDRKDRCRRRRARAPHDLPVQTLARLGHAGPGPGLARMAYAKRAFVVQRTVLVCEHCCPPCLNLVYMHWHVERGRRGLKVPGSAHRTGRGTCTCAARASARPSRSGRCGARATRRASRPAWPRGGPRLGGASARHNTPISAISRRYQNVSLD